MKIRRKVIMVPVGGPDSGLAQRSEKLQYFDESKGWHGLWVDVPLVPESEPDEPPVKA